jgi:hypothetical protein
VECCPSLRNITSMSLKFTRTPLTDTQEATTASMMMM